MGRKNSDFILFQTADLLDRGYRISDVAKELNINENTVRKYRTMLEDNPLTKEEIEVYRWLKENWHFTGRVMGPKRRKYRRVFKGQKGRLKTPYRPDKIFY